MTSEIEAIVDWLSSTAADQGLTFQAQQKVGEQMYSSLDLVANDANLSLTRSIVSYHYHSY
jgi:hypothetical protein